MEKWGGGPGDLTSEPVEVVPLRSKWGGREMVRGTLAHPFPLSPPLSIFGVLPPSLPPACLVSLSLSN